MRRRLSDPEDALRSGPLSYAARGFSLHAATRIPAPSRKHLPTQVTQGHSRYHSGSGSPGHIQLGPPHNSPYIGASVITAEPVVNTANTCPRVLAAG